MSFIPEIELQSREKQEQFQFKKLKELLHYLSNHSPYYQRIFKENGTDINAIYTLKDLHQLPITTKADLQLYHTSFLCVPPSSIREYTATSGSTGQPLTIALTEADLNRLSYNEYLSFGCMEIGPGDIFQLLLTLDRQFMAGMAYHDGLRQSEVAAIRTGPGLPAMQWETIQQLKSSGLIAVPSFLLKMIQYAADNNIDLMHTSVKKVLAIGESLRDDNLMPNALAQKITEAWKVTLFNTYASTEMQTAFTECIVGKGGHHHPELIIVELLDEEGQAVPEGEKGEVTITTLGVEGMPLLRYRTGDLCKAYYEYCSCGRTTMRLGPVLGRRQQMIKLKGTTFYPPAIFELLHQTDKIIEFQVEVFTNAEGQDDLLLYLTTAEQPESCNLYLKPLFKHKLRVVPDIRYISPEEMQKKQFPNAIRKPIRFKDLRL